MKLVKDLRTFNPIKGNNAIKDVYEVQKNSNGVQVFQPKVTKHMSDIDEAVKGFIADVGKNPETTGFVVFTK